MLAAVLSLSITEMSSQSKHVILLKSLFESENEREDMYYVSCKNAGLNVSLVPVLEFEFLNLGQLLDKIKKHDDYSGDYIYMMFYS